MLCLQNNRWRKRALSLVPLSYPVSMVMKYPVLVSIYDKDGTVAVSHGGVEMGQGLNTKVRMTPRLNTIRSAAPRRGRESTLRV